MELLNEMPVKSKTEKLRVGFAGVGWIGKNRMEAIDKSDLVQIAAVADPVPAYDFKTMVPYAKYFNDFQQMLVDGLDAVVIATPSALHASQTIEALRKGASVFCQKPLGRTAQETLQVVETAKQMNLLLGIDFSYRYVRAVQEIYNRILQNAIGDIFALRLVFHNAYGPDKDWFYKKDLSGGGCIIDLGVHLINMAVWILNSPKITKCNSQLYSNGSVFDDGSDKVEDYATAQLLTDTGVTIDLACSWNLSVGKDAIIEADFFGTKGSLALRNINGSFYDFRAYQYNGSNSQIVVDGQDNWSGRAGVRWAEKLVKNSSYDPSIETVLQVSKIIDMIYGR